jgi:hypothetical protein
MLFVSLLFRFILFFGPFFNCIVQIKKVIMGKQYLIIKEFSSFLKLLQVEVLIILNPPKADNSTGFNQWSDVTC